MDVLDILRIVSPQSRDRSLHRNENKTTYCVIHTEATRYSEVIDAAAHSLSQWWPARTDQFVFNGGSL